MREASGARLSPARMMFAPIVALLMSGAVAIAAERPAFPPDYTLQPIAFPASGGRYPVGTRSFELARADGTPLGIVAWYPAAAAKAPRAPYLTEDERRITAPALGRTFGWPAPMLDGFGALVTNAHLDAPIARGRFPLVIFSHGFLMYPRQNSTLMERLAAAGYVVLSIAHPGDAADQPSSRGPLPTRIAPVAPDPDPKASADFWAAADLETQRKLLPRLWASPQMQAMESRQTMWRDDLRILADAVTAGAVPSDIRPIAAAIRPGRFALAGMSFGGSTSASACSRDARCVAAINLDGIEFDRTLYGRDFGKPILLIQSDWHTYPNAGPKGRGFTSYDLAYERRESAGRSPDVHRYRLTGITHLGMSDLILARRDGPRDALLGTIDGARATAAIDGLSLAFLDRYLARRAAASVADTARQHPDLVRHSAGSTEKGDDLPKRR